MLSLILIIAVCGVLAWLLLTYVPMPQPFKIAIIAVIAICLIVYLFRAFGVSDVPVPQVN